MSPTSTSSSSADPRYDWLAELPLTPGPPDLRMGLRALPPERWLLRDASTEDELALRADLLDAHGDTMVRSRPGAEAAVAETAALAVEHLGLDPLPAGLAVDETLDHLGRRVQEDLYVLVPSVERADGGRWTLVAGVSVFANQFLLTEIIGGSPATIHGPVEGYDELMGAKVDAFFDNLAPGRSAWRRNWFLHDLADRYQPDGLTPVAFDEPERAAGLHLRSEYETLRKLTGTGGVVFTVKTQIAPLPQVAARPTVAEGVAGYLEAATPRGLRGKDAQGRHRAVIAYLRSGLEDWR